MAALLVVLFLLPACERGPKPLDYGRGACDSCSMSLADKHFGAQYVTDKGKTHSFDDVNCLVRFIGRENAANDAKALLYVADYNNRGALIDAGKAFFLHHESLRSPMRSDTAAFSDAASARAMAAQLKGGEILSWEEVLAKFQP